MHVTEDEPDPKLVDLLNAKCGADARPPCQRVLAGNACLAEYPPSGLWSRRCKLQQLPDYRCDKCKEVGTTRRRAPDPA